MPSRDKKGATVQNLERPFAAKNVKRPAKAEGKKKEELLQQLPKKQKSQGASAVAGALARVPFEKPTK